MSINISSGLGNSSATPDPDECTQSFRPKRTRRMPAVLLSDLSFNEPTPVRLRKTRRATTSSGDSGYEGNSASITDSRSSPSDDDSSCSAPINSDAVSVFQLPLLSVDVPTIENNLVSQKIAECPSADAEPFHLLAKAVRKKCGRKRKQQELKPVNTSNDDGENENSDAGMPESGNSSSKAMSKCESSNDESHVGRMLMRQWLEMHADKGTFVGLKWLDEKERLIEIAWKHKSRKEWSHDDVRHFESWADYTGHREPGSNDVKRWKANFRCAIHTLADVREEQSPKLSRSGSKGRDFKIFRLLDASAKNKMNKPKRMACRKKTPSLHHFHPAASRVKANSNIKPVNEGRGIEKEVCHQQYGEQQQQYQEQYQKYLQQQEEQQYLQQPYQQQQQHHIVIEAVFNPDTGSIALQNILPLIGPLEGAHLNPALAPRNPTAFNHTVPAQLRNMDTASFVPANQNTPVDVLANQNTPPDIPANQNEKELEHNTCQNPVAVVLANRALDNRQSDIITASVSNEFTGPLEFQGWWLQDWIYGPQVSQAVGDMTSEAMQYVDQPVLDTPDLLKDLTDGGPPMFYGNMEGYSTACSDTSVCLQDVCEEIFETEMPAGIEEFCEYLNPTTAAVDNCNADYSSYNLQSSTSFTELTRLPLFVEEINATVGCDQEEEESA